MSFRIRVAMLDDVPILERLIAESVRGLATGDYSSAQIEAALGTAWGVDSQLIRDRSYFVVETNGRIVGCGGWSRRKTLFGGDSQAGREPELLDPAKDSARIRAFFVHPDFARQGIGRLLLEKCETEALSTNFRTAELIATLPGERLYRAFGYKSDEPREYLLSNGLTILFVPMWKEIGNRVDKIS